VLVGNGVQRGDLFGGKPAGFRHDCIDKIITQLGIARMLLQVTKPTDMFERKGDLVDRSAIHSGPPKNQPIYGEWLFSMSQT
jgi:hypothetical protein